MTIVIIGLLLGAYTLFKKVSDAAKARQAELDANPPPQEPALVPQQDDYDDDAIGGDGIDPSGRGNRGVGQAERDLF